MNQIEQIIKDFQDISVLLLAVLNNIVITI